MTVAPDVPAPQYDDLAGAVAVLRDRGLRLSTARRLVLEALFAVDGPVSAEHLQQRLGLELSSVYRNLETLEQHGLVRHVHLGHGPGLYALLVRGEPEYLFCDRCGAVLAVPAEELAPVREEILERFGFEARFQHFALVGLCPACSGRRPVATASPRSSPGWDVADRQHEHAHSHGDRVHSHPDPHLGGSPGEHGHERPGS